MKENQAVWGWGVSFFRTAHLLYSQREHPEDFIHARLIVFRYPTGSLRDSAELKLEVFSSLYPDIIILSGSASLYLQGNEPPIVFTMQRSDSQVKIAPDRPSVLPPFIATLPQAMAKVLEGVGNSSSQQMSINGVVSLSLARIRAVEIRLDATPYLDYRIPRVRAL